MKRVLLVPLLLAGVLAQAAEVQVLGSRQSAVFTIDRNGQSAQAEVMAVRVAIETGSLSHDQRLADLLLLRDPETGLFMWRYQHADLDHPSNMIEKLQTESAVFIQSGTLKEFRWTAPFLCIRRIAEHHASMEDGLASVLRTLQVYGTSASDIPPYQKVNLGHAVDLGFMYGPRGERADLGKVVPDENRWKILLKGPNGDTALVVLSDEFKIVPAQ